MLELRRSFPALLSAACASPNPQSANRYNTGPTPSGYIYASSEQACADYGFVSGSATFDCCVSRERAARSAGRMTQTYEQSRLTIDARTPAPPMASTSGPAVSTGVSDVKSTRAAIAPKPR